MRGALEKEIMDVLWATDEATVSEVNCRLAGERAHTTVMTVLDRLYAKGLVRRVKRGRAWVYRPDVKPEEIVGHRLGDLLQEGDSVSDALLLAFVDRTERVAPQVLDRLAQLIESRQRRKK
jgi:BlaI family transcriptional regulator, penicillinase repressor